MSINFYGPVNQIYVIYRDETNCWHTLPYTFCTPIFKWDVLCGMALMLYKLCYIERWNKWLVHPTMYFFTHSSSDGVYYGMSLSACPFVCPSVNFVGNNLNNNF